MASRKSLYFFASYFITYFATAQPVLPENQQKIATSIAGYFKLDRENIHLHLNKTVYSSNEQIWFKGYAIEKKHKPTQKTSNVYISLYDSNGLKITTKLHYAEGNIFEGSIKLDPKLPTGKYFLQAYTNFMNNFSEDESSVYEIEILNENEPYFVPKSSISYNSITVSFFPESGIFLEGIQNTIGVKVSDCNDRGISIQDAEILDSKGNTVTTFSTDAFGYGKFDIYETKSEPYKAVFNANGKKKEQPLPMPVASGISFSVNNYTYPDKTIVKIRTNPKTINQAKNIPYTLVFQQDEATSFVDFSLKDTKEQTLVVPSEKLPEGINCVYLIDQNLNKIGERMIFKPFQMPEKCTLEMAVNRKDSIVINGSSRIISGTMSVSVLPAATLFESLPKTIQTDFLFDNYLSKPLENAAYYLKNFSRKKHYELDNLLMSRNSKYKWDAMMGDAPTVKFANDKGLTIKGTVNSELKNPKEYLVNMTSIGLGINEFRHLNDKKEFFFENIIAQDSTKFYFVAVDKNEKKSTIKIYGQLINNNRMFNKPLVIIPKICAKSEVSDKTSDKIPFPKIKSAIALDNVTVTAKKNILTHQKQSSNAIAKGFKISDADANQNRDVLQFIGDNGFIVSSFGGKVSIINNHARLEIPSKSGSINRSKKNANPWSTNRYSDTNRNMNGPAIYLDDIALSNYDLLRDYTMNQIDEIYINKTMNDLSLYGSSGIIRIYTKPNTVSMADKSNASEALVVKNGFQVFKPYQNPKYDNMTDEGFQKLGTIDWNPFVPTDKNGNFSFTIPNFYQKSIKIIIEGMSADGEMISEIKTLNIP